MTFETIILALFFIAAGVILARHLRRILLEKQKCNCGGCDGKIRFMRKRGARKD